ncbi:MAG: hypothetical protein HXY50_11845 [Ignavibacteriaceae bacterium]|nr:hypothetical protein [Ignavibacteriaceae bacterium]
MQLLQGGLGAILEEYKKASEEFISVIRTVTDINFVRIVDTETTDEDCRSVQTICRHVIRSGYGYANYILNELGITPEFPLADEMKLENSKDVELQLREMIYYNIKNLYEMNREKIEENMFTVKFVTRWGEEFNFEQILEHAVVHILRHRRQIEKFIRLHFSNILSELT